MSASPKRLGKRWRLRVLALAAFALLGGSLAAASAASAATVYDNVPSPLPGNLPSLGYEANSTSEFGGLVGLAGTERYNPDVTVTMSSWACQTGSGTSCTTTPGATFSHPITLNLYHVLPSGEPGGLIGTRTQTFNIPFRPSADPNCPTPSQWSTNPGSESASNCFNGLATNITFSAPGLSLPDQVIVALAYNTTHYGYHPIGGTGGPYDSLNVGLRAPPSVGTLPRPDDAYLNSSWSGAYCDNGTAGTGFLRLDTGCWTLQPAVRVDAVNAAGPPGPPGPSGPSGGVKGATGKSKCKRSRHTHKRQRRCHHKKKHH
jgi:hypothetical protein